MNEGKEPQKKYKNTRERKNKMKENTGIQKKYKNHRERKNKMNEKRNKEKF